MDYFAYKKKLLGIKLSFYLFFKSKDQIISKKLFKSNTSFYHYLLMVPIRIYDSLPKVCLAKFIVILSKIYNSLLQLLFNFKNLRFFDIYQNFILKEFPMKLGKLHNLKTLDFSFNKLIKSIHSSISK